MTKRYLSRRDFAERIGVQPGTLSRYRLPEPDVIVGTASNAARGWLPETVDAWNRERPGSPGRSRLQSGEGVSYRG